MIRLLHCQDEFSNPRIRDDQALNEIFSNSDKMHRDTSNDAYTQAWFDYSRLSVFPTVCEKIGKDVELFNVPTDQCSIIFNYLGFFNRKSEFQKPENLNKPITKGVKFNIAELSLQGTLEKRPCSCYHDGRGGQFADKHKAIA